MATITINKLIGGDINIITTGGNEQTQKIQWGQGVWVKHIAWSGTDVVLRYDSENDWYCTDDGNEKIGSDACIYTREDNEGNILWIDLIDPNTESSAHLDFNNTDTQQIGENTYKWYPAYP